MSGDIRAAITDQLGNFARLLDRKSWGALDRVFSAEVAFDYGEGRKGAGLPALRDLFRRHLDLCGPSQHLLGSIVIDLTDPSAPISFSYVQARHCGKGETAGEWFDTSGEYSDTWRRGQGEWKIVQRVADFPLIAGNPEVIAFDQVEP
jgi:hypothetical protein